MLPGAVGVYAVAAGQRAQPGDGGDAAVRGAAFL